MLNKDITGAPRLAEAHYQEANGHDPEHVCVIFDIERRPGMHLLDKASALLHSSDYLVGGVIDELATEHLRNATGTTASIGEDGYAVSSPPPSRRAGRTLPCPPDTPQPRQPRRRCRRNRPRPFQPSKRPSPRCCQPITGATPAPWLNRSRASFPPASRSPTPTTAPPSKKSSTGTPRSTTPTGATSCPKSSGPSPCPTPTTRQPAPPRPQLQRPRPLQQTE
uniref:Uncharacterized protein n=1 Tax=Paenarthrobacter nicotinovorans TaxID=29320 RepID=Q8GAN3_PAENI|nr:hypothetical protein [Paenarthrobacter nicotinovorans]